MEMWTIIFFFIVAAADKLVQVQVLYRHGDRTPLYTFKNDPNQDFFGNFPPGTLTKEGMAQHILQGRKLKKLYIDTHNFVNGQYDPSEIHIRSAETHRCIQSAASNLAAFYSQSTFHPDVDGWPSNNWTPMPITTFPGGTDDILEEGSGSCKRTFALENKRLTNVNYQKYIAENARFLMNLTLETGQQILTSSQISHLYDTLTVEKAHNLTLPSWCTDDVYAQLGSMDLTIGNFIDGVAILGVEEDTEIISLRSGMLVKKFLKNIRKILDGTTLYNKFLVYSAHDSTISALFNLLHIKQAVLGFTQPQYAAHVSLELWEANNSQHYIKMLYADNAQLPFRDITNTIPGCGGSDKCSLADFQALCEKYIPHHFWKTCEDVNVRKETL